MKSWILAFALAFAASGATAENTRDMPAPDSVPKIPSPWEPLPVTTPLDGPWPASASESTASVVDDAGVPMALPEIPAPELASADAVADADPSEMSDLAETPSPEKVRPPFDPAGTVHVVEKGDTLWDISDLYLGTPWIWPSVWKDNEDIENPHLILPGDKIWVSATEMRKVTDAEAAALLAARDAEGDDSAPAAMAEDAPSVVMPSAPKQYFHYAEFATVGVVRKKELKGYAQIAGTIEEAVHISQGDVVFVDLGDEDTAVGDEFTVFRTTQQIRDPSAQGLFGIHRVIGHHTEILGWLEVLEVYEESARAQVRMAYADFVPGAYLKPREEAPGQIEIKGSPVGVEGQLADVLVESKYNANGDVVVLNRGSEDGLEVGSSLEIYRPVSRNWKPEWYGREPDIEIPHEVVAQMIVLSTEPTTAMAYVRKSKTEIWHGDRFRTVNGPSVEWPEGGLFILPRIKHLAKAVPRPPEIEMPDVLESWNLPRLSVDTLLDGYDPR